MPDIASKSTTNWADDDDDNGFPTPLETTNPDGTKTVISYRVNPETGKKVKVTQKIKTTVVKERVNSAVAERRRWAKFGMERGARPGPDVKTTSVGENLPLKLVIGWKEEEVKVNPKEQAARVKAITCRTCGGEHFTSRCPFKDRFASADVAADDSLSSTPRMSTPEPSAAASATSGPVKSAYVPPHLRNRAGGAPGRGEGEKMGSYRDRDDNATLRVSNISEDATEEDLARLFERYGRIARVYLAKDRETGRPKGYAFINYYDVHAAEVAYKRMDGYGFDNLILRVEFSKRS
ncbi:eukaryotic translation initiation factor 3 subunit G-domain-containing protein [Dipodascopsis uninucleata]